MPRMTVMVAGRASNLRKALAGAVFGIALAVGPVDAQLLNAPGPAIAPNSANPAESSRPAQPNRSIEIYGSWSVQCVTREETRECFAETRVRVTEPEPRDVVLIRVTRREGALVVAVAVPEGVLLTSPVALVADELRVEATYQICRAQQCTARVALSSAVVSDLESRSEMQVLFVLPGQREVTLPISLDGFNDAVRAL